MDINIKSPNVTIWGTTGSGKTMLIRAFAKEITWYDEHDPDFSYSLFDSEGRTLSPYFDQHFAEATSYAEDHVWNFERMGKKLNSRPHQISAHSHQLIVHDNPGSKLINALIDPEDEQPTLSALRYSDSLIILLDPTNIKDSPVSTATEAQLSKADYTKLMQALTETALGTNHRQINVALCISKSDLLKIVLPVEELIKVIFGDGILRTFQHPRINSRYFRVSSVGKVRVLGGKIVPNISDDMVQIRDYSAWNPVNVVSPFFWLFETAEREKIKTSSKLRFFGDRLNYYIPYPPPRRA